MTDTPTGPTGAANRTPPPSRRRASDPDPVRQGSLLRESACPLRPAAWPGAARDSDPGRRARGPGQRGALRGRARPQRRGQGRREAVFLVELAYGGVFTLANIPGDSLQPLLLIECPRLLFPFARRIVADATRDGGFPPLMIDPSTSPHCSGAASSRVPRPRRPERDFGWSGPLRARGRRQPLHHGGHVRHQFGQPGARLVSETGRDELSNTARQGCQ